MRAAHQLLSGFADGDAISTCARVLRDQLRALGFQSELYVVDAHCSPSLRGECRPMAEYKGRAGDLVLHHFSIASPAQVAYLQSPASRVMIYHNITPPEYFDGFDDRVATQLREARAALPNLVAASAACWAVSRFNAAELEAVGGRHVRIFPLVWDPKVLPQAPDGRVLDKFAARLTTFLFVGRIAPNKKLEDLIETFCWYQKTIQPFSRLVLVGSDRSCPRYYAMLRMLAGDFDLPNVCFEGFASPEGLATYYRVADAFVTTSEHEGYCLPLLEAMQMGVPVVAPDRGGMPEAMDGAGVLYQDLPPAELACLLHRVVSDGNLRAQVLESQDKRVARARQRDIPSELRALLADLRTVAVA